MLCPAAVRAETRSSALAWAPPAVSGQRASIGRTCMGSRAFGAKKLLAVDAPNFIGHNRCTRNRCPPRAPRPVGPVHYVNSAPGGCTRRGCARLGS